MGRCDTGLFRQSRTQQGSGAGTAPPTAYTGGAVLITRGIIAAYGQGL